jgi:protein-S-isoprenylcysteine O-methyltransferase Ste14
VKEGPYKFVRHPGYAGALVDGLATPLVLGSLWGLVATVALVILLVIRTALEDQTLLEELAGYRSYVQETQYRLLPGIW